MEFNTLIKTYDLYPGNFVKDMIKLDNIVEDVIKIAIILNKEKLVSTASIIHEKIIRENVNTESLYVNKKWNILILYVNNNYFTPVYIFYQE